MSEMSVHPSGAVVVSRGDAKILLWKEDAAVKFRVQSGDVVLASGSVEGAEVDLTEDDDFVEGLLIIAEGYEGSV